jgi:uncharacterized membrane protein YheB (UPF0754 family)
MRENKLFKDFHESRIKSIKLQIEEGLIPYGIGEEILEKVDLDSVTPEEIKAHAELKEYAESIQLRQQQCNMKDIAEIVVDNKMLINQIDEALGNKPSADSGIKYSQLEPAKMGDTYIVDTMQSCENLHKVPSAQYLADAEQSLSTLEVNRLYADLIELGDVPEK